MEVRFCTYDVWRFRAAYGVCSKFGRIRIWLLGEVCMWAWVLDTDAPFG
jgi:hypothetical protein